MKLKEFLQKKYFYWRNRLGISPDFDLGERLDQSFNKLAWLRQSPEMKQQISLEIADKVNTGKIYWLELILATFIATLGLLQNSVAVIIGAMLIAPLLRPIQAMAFAIANGRSKLFWRAARLLTISTAVAIFVAYIVCIWAPYTAETAEIISRTAPNLFDLFIAIASAVVASLAHVYKRLYESVAGVAMATALAPPLAVIGIEIFFGNFVAAWGSFVLFATNLLGILLVASLLFILYGFNPHQNESKKTVRRLLTLVLGIMILWIPLSASFNKLGQQTDLQIEAQALIRETFARQNIEARVSNLDIDVFSKEQILIRGQLALPLEKDFNSQTLYVVAQTLSDQMKREVKLDLEITRSVVAESE